MSKEVDEIKQFIFEYLNVHPRKTSDVYFIGKAYYWSNRIALENWGSIVSSYPCIKTREGHDIKNLAELLDDMTPKYLENTAMDEYRAHTNPSLVEFRKEIMGCIKLAYDKIKRMRVGDIFEEMRITNSFVNVRLGDEIDFLDDVITPEELEKTKNLSKNVPKFG